MSNNIANFAAFPELNSISVAKGIRAYAEYLSNNERAWDLDMASVILEPDFVDDDEEEGGGEHVGECNHTFVRGFVFDYCDKCGMQI